MEPASVPEILIYAYPGYEIEALRRLGEWTKDGGAVCEFSTFDTLEQSMEYAGQRGIARVIAVGAAGGEIDIYEV